jgi:hypothetical protein
MLLVSRRTRTGGAKSAEASMSRASKSSPVLTDTPRALGGIDVQGLVVFSP